MKYLVLALGLCLLAGVLAEEDAIHTCMNECGFDEEQAKKFKEEPAESTEAKCFASCLGKAMGIFVDDKLEVEKCEELLGSIYAEDERSKTVAIGACKKCEDETEAYKAFTCIDDHFKEHGLKHE